MATLQQVVELVFEGIDKASPEIRGLAKSLEDLSDSAKQVTEPAAAVTKALLEIETAALATGAALVALAIRDAGQFDTSFRFITTLFESTGAASQQFRGDILDYAKTSTQSLDSITGALNEAIGAGVDYSQSLGLLADAEKLAVAQGGTLDDATRLLVSTLNAYGLEVDQAAKLSDYFSVAIRDGKISIADLAEGLSQITPLAAKVGLGVDQVGAALAVLTQNGVPASQAITAVRDIISKTINPTDEAAKAAKELGIEFGASALQSKGLVGILADMIDKTKGNVTAQTELFTTDEALKASLLLTANSGKAFADELKSMASSAGATEAAFNKMAGSLDQGAQQIANAIKVAFVNLGTPLLDEFGKIQQAIASIFNTIGDSFESGALKSVVTELEKFGNDLVVIFESVAKNLPEALGKADLSGFLSAIERVSKAIQAVFSGLNLDTSEGLANAITALGKGFDQLTEFSIEVFKALGPVFETIKELGSLLISLNPQVVKLGAEVGAWSIVFNAVAPAMDTALLALIAFGGKGGTAIKALGAEITALQTVLASGSIAAALGTAGIAGAIGLMTYELGRWANLNDKLIPDSWSYEGATLGTVLADVAEKLGLMGTNVDQTGPKLQQIAPAFLAEAEAAKKTNVEINAWLDAQEKSAKIASDSKGELESLKRYYENLGYAYDTATGALTKLNAVQEKDLYALAENIQRVGNSYEQIGGGTVKATGAFKAVGDSASESAKKVDEATKKSDEFLIKMEEIASNERIKTIEAVVSLNIAALEADVKRVESLFASIDNTVSSTGDLLGSLFGNLTDTTDRFKELEIQEQIDMENKRRQEALDMQKKLAEAEIARIQAQTAALERGNAVIEIDGKGLQPQLEAFMWEILKAIRVQVNAEFADYLLGVPA